jgi:hypothetical protein
MSRVDQKRQISYTRYREKVLYHDMLISRYIYARDDILHGKYYHISDEMRLEEPICTVPHPPSSHLDLNAYVQNVQVLCGEPYLLHCILAMMRDGGSCEARKGHCML